MNNAHRPKILVTRLLPNEVEQRIAKTYDAVSNSQDELLSRDEIIARAHGCRAILVTPTEKCDAALINALPGTIEMIATFSVGFDHIDVAAAQARSIRIANTPDVITNAAADITWLLILGAARGAGWGENMIRTANWDAWCPTQPLGVDVTGKRLGIYGMGRIGQAVAKRARGFDMEIHYHSRNRLGSTDELGAHFHDSLDDLMPHCDFLSINCASTQKTRGSINAARISALPANAVLVNTARGEIVDDDAVIQALGNGKLAAAGLDVFSNEPDIDPRYRDLENTFLLPHLGSATTDTRIIMGQCALDNLDAHFAGKHPGGLLA